MNGKQEYTAEQADMVVHTVLVKELLKKNNLAVKYPELIKEWHPTKNKNLAPYDVMPSSGKKVWWLCSQEHEWKTRISDRSRGRGCPYCAGARADSAHTSISNEILDR